MTPTEERLIVQGARYMTSLGSISLAELDGHETPGTFKTDARDSWYTARDLSEPDHEHVWISEQAICDPTDWAVCSRCGQRTDYAQ